MHYKGYKPGVADKFKSWYLPERIAALLRRRIVDLKNGEPPEFDPNSDRLFFHVGIVDPEYLGYAYDIYIEFCRDDDGYWIENVEGSGIDPDGKVFWTSRTKGP